MTAYLTKNKDGIVFLWNNKPEYNKYGEFYMAWEAGHEGEWNEVGIDVTANEYFRNIFPTEPPCAVKIELNIENIDTIKIEDVLEETENKRLR